MSRPALHFLLSLAAAAAGGAALESASRAQAQARVPLLNEPSRMPAPAPAWSNTSWNCTNTVPSLVDFDKRYRDQGLSVIGVHTPEFPPYAGEHDKGNVERALRKYGIEYPNAQDNDSKTWDLYNIRYWPSFVLIDKRGNIRYEGYGEFHLNDGTYRRWDERMRQLLEE